MYYIHLNPVRAKIVKRPGEWTWSGHGEYLGKEKRRLIDAGPVREELETIARYEAFIRDGVKEEYRPEWHPGDHAPFFGTRTFRQEAFEGEKIPAALAPPDVREPVTKSRKANRAECGEP